MYETVEQLEEAIEDFFEQCDDKPTITGLAYWLGFESRQSFYAYEGKEQFSYTLKRARLRIESNYEKMLQKQSCAGAIFALKNFGWIDKQEIDHTSKGEKIVDTKEMEEKLDRALKVLHEQGRGCTNSD